MHSKETNDSIVKLLKIFEKGKAKGPSSWLTIGSPDRTYDGPKDILLWFEKARLLRYSCKNKHMT